jgi:hypothetical protein
MADTLPMAPASPRSTSWTTSRLSAWHLRSTARCQAPAWSAFSTDLATTSGLRRVLVVGNPPPNAPDARSTSGPEYLIGPVVRMLGTTAIRAKSPKHAELFLKAVGAIGAKEAGESGAGQTFAAGQAVYNFLVPAPPIPTLVHAEAKAFLPRR